jgi:hypothetical protein
MADSANSINTKVKTTSKAQEVPSAFSLFRPSWEGLKLNILELVVFFLVPTAALTIYFAIVSAAASVTGNGDGIGTGSIVLFAVGGLAALIYGVLLGPAIVHIQLKSARMEKASYQSAWEVSKKFWWRFLLLSLTVGIVIFIGLLLLIVPGIIFIRRYFLSQYALIDRDLGLGASMRASDELSRGRAMSIFGIIGVDILINVPSFIPIIGSVITFLLQIAYFCAPAIRYQQLKSLKPVESGKSTA